MAQREDFWISRDTRGGYFAHNIEPVERCGIWVAQPSAPANEGISICPQVGRALAPDLEPGECQGFRATPGQIYYWDPEA